MHNGGKFFFSTLRNETWQLFISFGGCKKAKKRNHPVEFVISPAVTSKVKTISNRVPAVTNTSFRSSKETPHQVVSEERKE